MDVSNGLELTNLGVKNWLVKPKKVPILPKDKFIVNLYNNSSEAKVVLIKGFYSILNVISVQIFGDDNNLIDTVDISDIRKAGYEITINSEDKVRIRVKYKRTYKKEGFIRAGRLKIEGV